MPAAALAEHLHDRTVDHVLDDTGDALPGLQRDRAGPFGHLGRGHLRRGHHQDLGTRDQLGDRDRDVTGAGRQVQQQHVQVTPVHVGEELLQRAVQHRTAPHHRCVALGEHRDRDHPHVVGDRGQDHRVDLGGAVGRPHHAWYGVPVDVGVQHAHREAPRGQRRRQVDRDAGFADPALARRDGVDLGQRAGLGERDHRFPRVATQQLAQLGALLVVHDVQAHAHRTGAGHVADRPSHLLADLGLLRTGRRGEVDLDMHRVVVVDGDVLDHADLGDRTAQLGVDHLGQCGADRRFQVMRSR